MKFNKPELDHKGNEVRHSPCGRFFLIKPTEANRKGWWMKDKEQFVLREGKGGWISVGWFVTVQAASQAADEAEKLRAKVMPYFIERAKYEMRYAKKLLDEKEQTVEERAERLYEYEKYRAFAKSSRSVGALAIDPAAYRDWRAMLDGTYVQWWKKKVA